MFSRYMSTSLLISKMKDAAKERGEEVEINALAIAECSSIINEADILAILVVFLIARNVAKTLKSDDLLAGLTAASVYFIIYSDYNVVDGVNNLSTKFMHAQGLFVAILVGLLVG